MKTMKSVGTVAWEQNLVVMFRIIMHSIKMLLLDILNNKVCASKTYMMYDTGFGKVADSIKHHV